MQDPINAELLQQLSDYLDDDSKIVLKQAQSQAEKKEQAEQADTSSGSVDMGDNSSSAPMGGGSHGPSFSGSPIDDFGDDELADIDLPDDGGEPADMPEEPEAVESVTKEGKPITSATIIYWNTLDDVVSDCETIKGTLNTREDTKGVTRLQVIDHELWIYYNDDSNLNDKMIEVISVLNSVGYTYLKFNRLARSNNAIVFDILLNDTELIKSVKAIEEETK